MRRTLIAAAAVALVGLVVASSVQASGHRASVKTRHGALGTYLVNGKGRTLYLFAKDKTTKSTCSAACAANWPPLLTSGRPKASGSARRSLLGTTRRSDGTRQVTYKGHPVYLFIADHAPGDTNGQGVDAFGAKWYAVAPSGRRIGGRY